MSPIVEDYSDLAAEEDEQWLQDKVADFKVRYPTSFFASPSDPSNHKYPDEKLHQKRSFPSGRYQDGRALSTLWTALCDFT